MMKRGLPALLIAALVLPSVAWIFMDQRVWPWDPAYYGYWTLQAVEAMPRGLRAWIDINLHSLKMMPPLITWLGQFLVPLRHLTGQLETALMMQIVLMAVATLLVVYRTSRTFAPTDAQGRAVGMAAIAVCGGAPLFIGLSHHYLTEMSQCLAAALSVAVAWRVERRSMARNIAYIALMTAFAFLSKASSLVFVLPALSYIGVALVLTRRDARLPRTAADPWWLAAGVLAVGLTVAWYAANWQMMATHFVQASVGAEVQQYWADHTLADSVVFWTLSLADALSLSRLVPAIMVLAVVAVLVIAVLKLRRERRPGHAAVTSGVLFALYLAGTVVAVILAYAQQINEDPRYVVALVPIIAVLTAWVLSAMNHTAAAFLVTAVFVVNAAFAHAGALGFDVPKRYGWTWVVDFGVDERATLTGIVAATCQDGEAHAVAMGVSYPWANGNAANFYAGKRRLVVHADCVYHFVPQESLEKFTAWLDAAQVRYVVTVPVAQQDPENFANALAKPIAEYMPASPDFEFMESVGRYHIYRRITPGG